MPTYYNLGNQSPQNHWKISQKEIENFCSLSRASKRVIYSNNPVYSRYWWGWQKALDRKDVRVLTKGKVPQRKNWPSVLEKLNAEELLKKYGEWGTRTGKRVGNKWHVRLDVDLVDLPFAVKNTLDRGFNLLLNRQKIMFIKTKKGYHVILLLDELPPNGAVYHTDKFGIRRKVGDILSAGRQSQHLGSPDKEPAGQGKWAWQAKSIEVIAEIFKKYFFSIECKEKTAQKEVNDINPSENPKVKEISSKNAYKFFKLENIRIISKQLTKKVNHYRINYLDKWQNKGFFFLDSYFRDKKERIQPNLVGSFLLNRGYKYQFFCRFYYTSIKI